MTKHTPGPWRNARLIASAPDLLAALTELVDLHDTPADEHGPDGHDWGGALNAARVALAKARGES